MTPSILREAIVKAHKEKRIEDLSILTGLPVDAILGKVHMTRKERRKWYHENKKRLGLPKWDKLETLQ